MHEHIYICGPFWHKTTLKLLSENELKSAHIVYCLNLLLQILNQYHNQFQTIKLQTLVFLMDCWVILLKSDTQNQKINRHDK